MPTHNNPDLFEAEKGISSCNNYSNCNGQSRHDLSLSSVPPGDDRRGSRDPRILIVTEAPDSSSSEGSAYSGGLSDRLISLLSGENYGIGLNRQESDSFSDFLKRHRIYATSAVKCHFEGGGSNVGDYVVRNCRDIFLQRQIDALQDLELILPMGNVAAASILRKSLSMVKITSLIGTQGDGIHQEHSRYNVPVVLLPHPSGNSMWANAPLIDSNGDPQYWSYKIRFRRALVFIREVLKNMGYEVFKNSPKSWDRPPGLSGFL